MWSLMFILAEMRRPLPWARIRDKKDVHLCKLETTDKSLFENSPAKYEQITEHLRFFIDFKLLLMRYE